MKKSTKQVRNKKSGVRGIKAWAYKNRKTGEITNWAMPTNELKLSWICALEQKSHYQNIWAVSY